MSRLTGTFQMQPSNFSYSLKAGIKINVKMHCNKDQYELITHPYACK
jgi:hypothetical protein